MNILTIFNRESILNIKKRKLLISLSIATSIFAIVMLIVMNNIIVEADIYSYINYSYVRNMIKFSMCIEIFVVLFFSSIFLSNSINNDKNNLSLQNILVSNITINDLIIGKYINGILNTFSIVIAMLPIVFVSLFFGGFTRGLIFRFIIFIIFLNIYSSSLSIFISSKIRDTVWSLLISLMINFLQFVLLFFFDRYDNK